MSWERNRATPHKYTENILKIVSYTENKPKDTTQMGMDKKIKRKCGWFWHTTVSFSSKRTLK